MGEARRRKANFQRKVAIHRTTPEEATALFEQALEIVVGLENVGWNCSEMVALGSVLAGMAVALAGDDTGALLLSISQSAEVGRRWMLDRCEQMDRRRGHGPVSEAAL